MVPSRRTLQCKHLKNLFGFMHAMCICAPLAYFVPYAYITAVTTARLILTLILITSVIMMGISIFLSLTSPANLERWVFIAGLHRCVQWLVVSGVIFCIPSIKFFIWLVAIASILDEILFVRLRNKYRQAYLTNKEIDGRL